MQNHFASSTEGGPGKNPRIGEFPNMTLQRCKTEIPFKGLNKLSNMSNITRKHNYSGVSLTGPDNETRLVIRKVKFRLTRPSRISGKSVWILRPTLKVSLSWIYRIDVDLSGPQQQKQKGLVYPNKFRITRPLKTLKIVLFSVYSYASTFYSNSG